MCEVAISKDELVVLKGSLTSINVSEVQEYLEMALYLTPKITLDITELNKLDVAGVFMLRL
jgi:anti-anti-sigma regulatory factor